MEGAHYLSCQPRGAACPIGRSSGERTELRRDLHSPGAHRFDQSGPNATKLRVNCGRLRKISVQHPIRSKLGDVELVRRIERS